MKINNLALSAAALLVSLFSVQANAFKVEKMVIISDDGGNGIITLYNDQPHPIFISSAVEEIKIEDGTVIDKTKYDRNNLSDWKISLTHPKLILKPGESKDVGIRSLCHNTTCDDSRDLMFMLPFSPSKYRAPGEKQEGVEINYGFSPVYIIPTTNPTFDFNLINEGDKLVVNNKSNTMINVFVNSCTLTNSVQCKQKYIIVAGRDKSFALPKELQSENLNVTITSHDRSYSKKEILKLSGSL